MKLRLAILSAASLLLALLTGQINHYLAPLHLYLWCGGLFVAFAGLRLDYRSGAATSFVAGLILDATSPIPFGTQAFIFLTAHAFVFTIRARAPREETIVGVAVALLANLGMFLALGFLRVNATAQPADTWLRSFVDLIASQIFIAIIGPWFFAIQKRLLVIAGFDSRDYARRVI